MYIYKIALRPKSKLSNSFQVNLISSNTWWFQIIRYKPKFEIVFFHISKRMQIFQYAI